MYNNEKKHIITATFLKLVTLITPDKKDIKMNLSVFCFFCLTTIANAQKSISIYHLNKNWVPYNIDMARELYPFLLTFPDSSQVALEGGLPFPTYYFRIDNLIDSITISVTFANNKIWQKKSARITPLDYFDTTLVVNASRLVGANIIVKSKLSDSIFALELAPVPSNKAFKRKVTRSKLAFVYDAYTGKATYVRKKGLAIKLGSGDLVWPYE